MSLTERIKNAVVEESRNAEEKLTTVNGKLRLAIPSMWPGGIDSIRSEHFGRCDCMTLVDIDQRKVNEINVVPNSPHTQGDCLAPVALLRLLGANVIIVSGIEMRPLVGFREAGMEVYLGGGASVSDVILEFILEALTPISPQEACGGH